MDAFSIQQPWAWAILSLGKDIENRDWRPTNPGLRFRGRFLIHTGKVLDKDGIEYLLDMGHKPPAVLPLGGIVGMATIVACVTESKSDWFFGPYGFVLRNVVAAPNFVEYPGQLGFFNVPADVAMATGIEIYRAGVAPKD